jgi:hypothetical protein
MTCWNLLALFLVGLALFMFGGRWCLEIHNRNAMLIDPEGADPAYPLALMVSLMGLMIGSLALIRIWYMADKQVCCETRVK